MATIMTREQMDYEGVPVFGYGIEANTYEEAYEIAKQLFNKDMTEYIREQMEQIEEMEMVENENWWQD